MYRSKATQKLNNIAYALIIGGALGNLFDRLWHGFVVDMIDFYIAISLLSFAAVSHNQSPKIFE